MMANEKTTDKMKALDAVLLQIVQVSPRSFLRIL